MMFTKGCSTISYFFFRSWVVNKYLKSWFTLVYRNQAFFSFLQISQYLNKKNKCGHLFVEIGKWETHEKLLLKIFKYILEVTKVLNFSDKIPGFSKTMELCLNFRIGFCITLLELSNDKRKSVLKTQFYINHASLFRMSTE